MARAKVSEFIVYLNSKVGMPYLWGGQGETVYGLIKKLAKAKGQSTTDTEDMLKYLSKNGCKDTEFYDCSGLGVKFLMDKKVLTSDTTANGLYNTCTKISKADIRPGDMGFYLREDGTAHHIGYIVEGGYIIHAYDQKAGVIKEPVSARSKWVFGRSSLMEYDLDDLESEQPAIDINALKPGDAIALAEDKLGYNTAFNATSGTNPTVTYKAGQYYVYKVYAGAVNVTRKKGVAGAWVIL